MPFGPRSWMNDSWLTPTNSIWERKRDSPIFITLKSTIFFCFIKDLHKDLQNILSRCYPPSLKHLQEDKGKYFGWVFCSFILEKTFQDNSTPVYHRDSLPGVLPPGSLAETWTQGVCVILAGCLNPLLPPGTLIERLERKWGHMPRAGSTL